MQSSSLIFVIVVAIWAVYLLQYWVKRRDHLSTVRSVDRFSAAMRVLDHHRLGREGAEPAPRSYAVAPTRTARPTVTVKRAEAPAVQTKPQTSGADAVAPSGGHVPSIVARVVDAPRKVRGLTFLAHLGLLPVVLLVAAFGPLPWWTPVVLLVGTAGAFGWLRQGVVEERAAARARERAARGEERTQRSARRPAPATRPAAVTEAAPAPARAETVFDVEPEKVEVPGGAEVAAVTTSVEEPVKEPVAMAQPGSWEPVPVPRPTYTMKAKAARREPAPLPETMTPVEAELDELPAVDGDLVDPGARAANG